EVVAFKARRGAEIAALGKLAVGLGAEFVAVRRQLDVAFRAQRGQEVVVGPQVFFGFQAKTPVDAGRVGIAGGVADAQLGAGLPGGLRKGSGAGQYGQYQEGGFHALDCLLGLITRYLSALRMNSLQRASNAM